MNIYFQRSLIETTTDRAILFKLPKKDSFFWMPKSLVSLKGSKGSWLKLFIPDNFEITCKTKKGYLMYTYTNKELYESVKDMSDQIESSLSATKEKKINNFISNRVHLENPTSDINKDLIDG